MKNKRADRILSLFLMFQIFLAGTAFASPIGKVQEEKRNSEQNLSEVRREIEDLENQKEKILSVGLLSACIGRALAMGRLNRQKYEKH